MGVSFFSRPFTDSFVGYDCDPSHEWLGYSQSSASRTRLPRPVGGVLTISNSASGVGVELDNVVSIPELTNLLVRISVGYAA